MEGKDPILMLTMEKGPLEGQTLEFVPRSKIQIGRTVRGNTISIKDAGISTKHLGINFEDASGRAGSWIISDLGSSNGTFLNSDKLEPFMHVRLSNGDVIKIGEYTEIKVRIGVEVEVEESKVRRNPLRQRGRKFGAGSLSKTNVVEEKLGVETVEEIGNVGRDEAVAKLRPKRGKGVKKEEIEVVCADFNQNGAEGMKGKQVKVESSKRITRSMRNGGNLENLEETGILCGKELESSMRITRVMRKGENFESLEDSGLQGDKELGNKNVKKGRKGRRNLKTETLIECVEDETGESVEILEQLDSEVRELKVVNEELRVKEVVEEKDGRVVDGMVGKEGVNSGVEGCGASANTSGVKNRNSYELDLEKMTMGEWLDYLEVNLPKQIFDDTEEMILGMRQKAKKFHEFMLQRKNSKKKVEVPWTSWKE
ncbi:hypothetical protein ACH5RR_012789 [Cinchona calisaya]|uniref:FHA domain-containing protein n=1 Tax=Cinchona calisaya TaxID=153742 RepID=A0ABD3A9A5_9GENT